MQTLMTKSITGAKVTHQMDESGHRLIVELDDFKRKILSNLKETEVASILSEIKEKTPSVWYEEVTAPPKPVEPEPEPEPISKRRSRAK